MKIGRTLSAVALSILAASTAYSRTHPHMERVTGYCIGRPPCKICGTHGSTRTDSLSSRGVAVPRRLWKERRGQRLYIKGYGYATVDDSGSFRRGLDCRFRTHREAEMWSHRTNNRAVVQIIVFHGRHHAQNH